MCLGLALFGGSASAAGRPTAQGWPTGPQVQRCEECRDSYGVRSVVRGPVPERLASCLSPGQREREEPTASRVGSNCARDSLYARDRPFATLSDGFPSPIAPAKWEKRCILVSLAGKDPLTDPGTHDSAGPVSTKRGRTHEQGPERGAVRPRAHSTVPPRCAVGHAGRPAPAAAR